MAQKRMFSKEITNSDPFLDLPLSTQALYFHLGMNADDDGFVSPKSIMRLVQAKDDDLKMLIYKGFCIAFEDNIIVITHWKRNNNIRSDRYTPTIYKEHKKTLGLNDGAYHMYTNGIPSIDKVSIDKVSIDNIYPPKSGKYSEGYEFVWGSYPHARKGKKQEGYKLYKQQDEEDVKKQVLLYKYRIETGISNGSYTPAFERWIRDFTKLSASVIEQDMKIIVPYIKTKEGDDRKKIVEDMIYIFGKDKFEEIWKNNSSNKIVLNLK